MSYMLCVFADFYFEFSPYLFILMCLVVSVSPVYLHESETVMPMCANPLLAKIHNSFQLR